MARTPCVGQELVTDLVEQMRTFRAGLGEGVGLKLDLNYNFKVEGFKQVVQALSPAALGGRGLDWIELDLYEPKAPEGVEKINQKSARLPGSFRPACRQALPAPGKAQGRPEVWAARRACRPPVRDARALVSTTQALRQIRDVAPMPIASLESLMGRKAPRRQHAALPARPWA